VVWTDGGGDTHGRHSDGGFGTFDWTPQCVTFQAEVDTATIQCRLGHWASTVTGELHCDDMTVEAIDAAF
jgi:hypothetical protein